MLDLLITGGKVAFPGGVQEASLGIKDGKISGIYAPGEKPEAKKVKDVAGCYVMPGLIEPHSHLGVYNSLEEDFSLDTKFSAIGGYTSIFSFHREPGSYMKQIPEVIALGEKNSMIDFGFHLGLLVEDQVNEIPRHVNELGINSYKFYMGYKGMEKERFGSDRSLDDGFFYQMLEVMKKASDNCVMCVHAENIEIVNYFARVLKDEAEDTLTYFERLAPGFTETESIIRTSYLASKVGAKVYYVHTSAGESIDMIDHLPWYDPSMHYMETCMHYLSQTVDCPEGLLGKVKPPIRYQEDSDRLWEAVADGRIHTIGTDEAPNYLERKYKKGKSLSQTELGFSEMGFTVPLLFDEGYHKRGIPVDRLAEITSTNTAAIFGVYPQKGIVAVGSDADLVVVDPELKQTVKPDMFPRASDYSIFNGRELKGWPVMTVSRGDIIAEEGKITAPEGRGKYLRRSK